MLLAALIALVTVSRLALVLSPERERAVQFQLSLLYNGELNVSQSCGPLGERLAFWRKNCWALRPWPRGAIALTFDDLYTRDWLAAAELLANYSARATFFVTTQRMGEAEAGDLARLVRAGMELGHHSFSHRDAAEYVSGFDYSRHLERYLSREIARACDDLRRHALPLPASFAYPYGTSHEVLTLALAEHFAVQRGTSLLAFDARASVYNASSFARDLIVAPRRGARLATNEAGLRGVYVTGAMLDFAEVQRFAQVRDVLAQVAHEASVAVFFGHRFRSRADVEASAKKLFVDRDVLREILTQGRELGIEFIVLSETLRGVA